MTPQVIPCRACAGLIPWSGTGRRPHYCKDAQCHRARANDRAYRYFLRHRAKGAGTHDWPTSLPRPLAPPLPASQAGPVEPTATVERLLQAAKARRLREERRTGQRRYTITDGWQQKPGAQDWMDQDGQPGGWL